MSEKSAPPLAYSVVIPTFNSALYILKAIASAASQTCPPKEIIVVDDGSTDGTADLLNGQPHIRYLFQRNSGVSAARNRGIHEASAPLVALLDADDLWIENKSELQLRAFARDENLSLCASDAQVLLASGEIRSSYINNRYTEGQPVLPTLLAAGNFIATPTLIFTKELHARLGGFNEQLSVGEDYDFLLRAASVAHVKIISRPLAIVTKLRSDNLLSNRERTLRADISVLNLFLKRHSSHRALARRALYEVYVNFSRELLMWGRPREARDYLWKSLWVTDELPIAILRWLKSFLLPTIKRMLRKH